MTTSTRSIEILLSPSGHLRRLLSPNILRRGQVLALMLRFQQICNHPSQWPGDDAYAPADSGKLLRLRELCEEELLQLVRLVRLDLGVALVEG